MRLIRALARHPRNNRVIEDTKARTILFEYIIRKSVVLLHGKKNSDKSTRALETYNKKNTFYKRLRTKKHKIVLLHAHTVRIRLRYPKDEEILALGNWNCFVFRFRLGIRFDDRLGAQ